MEIPEMEAELAALEAEMAEQKSMDSIMSEDFGISEEEEIQRQERELKMQLEQMGRRLQSVADDCVNRRQDIEQRWLEDLRQYNGMYDEKTQENLKKSKGSKLFVNITRPKSTIAESRLADMLFPTDEKNWGIKPTPVPEMGEAAAAIKDVAPEQPVGMTPEGMPMMAGDVQKGIQDVQEEARRRATAMEREIDDQLSEANYEVKARDIIHDAVIMGTGVLKGPCIVGRTRRKWVEMDGVQIMQIVEDINPEVERVDIWDFFPDMSATRIEDAEYVLQRHYLNRKQLSDLRKTPGFMVECITELLENDPTTPTATYREELRSLSGINNVQDNRYEVWEYHGAVKAEDLQACGCEITNAEAADLEAVVWFSQGKVLKAIINPMETEDRPFSVFNWEEDDSSIFGFGIPFLLRTPQKAINSSFRMMMDNAGLSSGPQIVVNTQVIRPVDGSWSLAPRKVWEMTDKGADVRQAFGSFEVNAHLQELNAIFQQARAMADELINLPLIAQGEGAPHLTQTAKGMSILMNSANTTMRRAVKSWDDDVTKPMLRRFYDWNMQYSEKEEIKGDLVIIARGSSALLEREAQTEKLIGLMKMAPAMGGLVKVDAVARKLVQSMNLSADELVMTEEEIKQRQAQMQGQPQQPSPEQMKMQLEQAKLQLESQKMQINAQNEQMDFQTEQTRQKLVADRAVLDSQIEQQKMQMELQKMANERDISVDQLKVQLGMKKMELDSDEKKLAAEIEIKQIFGSGI